MGGNGCGGCDLRGVIGRLLPDASPSRQGFSESVYVPSSDTEMRAPVEINGSHR